MSRSDDATPPIRAVSSRIAYRNKWIRVREDQTIRKGDVEGLYGVVESSDSIIVCAVNDRCELCVIYAYNYPTDVWSWQLPTGGGENQPPLEAAKRELQEETGYVATDYESLGNLIVWHGISSERMEVVLATGLTRREHLASDDADTIIKTKFVSLAIAAQMVERGEICDCQSLAALYFVEKWMKQHGN